MGYRKIGLLGGSFNPAHEGHRQISLLALRRLGLDEVWWMVSPQNPLKPVAGMAPFAARLAGAARAAAHPRIRVTDIEARLGSRYTADSLRLLPRRFREARFVWLMGADNLIQIPKWRDWTRIFETVPIAVFDRPSYTYAALAGQAAQRFAAHRIAETAIRGHNSLADMTPPAWAFIGHIRHPASSTAIREASRTSGARQVSGDGPEATDSRRRA